VGGKSHQDEDDNLLPLPDIIQDSLLFTAFKSPQKIILEFSVFLGRHSDVTK
jgi:hypothetical protein